MVVIAALIIVSVLVTRASSEGPVGAKARDMALNEDDMPTGWTADPVNGSDVPDGSTMNGMQGVRSQANTEWRNGPDEENCNLSINCEMYVFLDTASAHQAIADIVSKDLGPYNPVRFAPTANGTIGDESYLSSYKYGDIGISDVLFRRANVLVLLDTGLYPYPGQEKDPSFDYEGELMSLAETQCDKINYLIHGTPACGTPFLL